MLTRSLPTAVAAACLLALTGCRDAKVTAYCVPKEKSPPASLPGAGASLAADLPTLTWKTPEGWSEQPGGSVRIASFVIQSPQGARADMAVTQFPGDVGGDLANVNRWRGQLQLGPITEADLPSAVTEKEWPAGKFRFTEIASETPVLEGKQHARILGAWIKHPERTWFFKMAGEAELVASQRDAFEAFMTSVQFGAPEPTGEHVHHEGDGHDHSHDGPAAVAATELTWSAPSAWKTKPLSTMRKGSFTLPGANGGEADFSIISFPGDAGGIVDNLNRWRGQIQLPPLPAAEMASAAQTVAHGNLRFTVVDYVSADTATPTRILGAVLPLDAETYFFKVTGPSDVVEHHKTAFLDFLKTIKTR